MLNVEVLISPVSIQAISIIEYNVQNKQFDLIDEQIDKIHNLVIKRNMMK